MPWTTTQPSLLLRLRNPEDHTSWREFDRRYGELILRYALGRGLQLTDAEDVRQEVLTSLVRTLPKFEYSPARGRFRSYLGRVVHHATLRQATRPFRSREVLCGEDTGAFDASAPPEPHESWEREWVNHHLRVALREVRRTFDESSVAAFERFLAGDDARTVAEKTGLTPAAAHKAKQRIRDRIRRLVERQLADEEDAP